MEIKVCSCCGKEKSIDQFYQSKINKDGLTGRCKDCIREHQRQYGAINKEKIIKYQEEYNNKNKDKIKKRRQEYALKNKETIRAYLKQYHVDYYARNIEHILEYNMKYNENNHLRRLITNCRTRAKSLNIPYDDADILQVYLQSTYDQGICEVCGKKLEITLKKKHYGNNSISIDRIVPENGYVIGNVAIICGECNRQKSDTSLEKMKHMVQWIESKIDCRSNQLSFDFEFESFDKAVV